MSFLSVWADRADLGSTETAKQKLRYAFSAFQGKKKKKMKKDIYFSIRTKKLHNI